MSGEGTNEKNQGEENRNTEGAGVRFAMVGGGSGAFIGAVHRMAIRLDGGGDLVAGALSSTPERSIESGRSIGLAADRAYPDWRAMLNAERARPDGDRIDAVSIVTPNHTHFEIARACLEAGFHVVLDKPMVTTSAEARELAALASRGPATLTVTYNYSGYPMVREARELVRAGALGAVRKVFAEYHQGWLATDLEAAGLEAAGQKQASWRTDPAKTGGAGALGDIGTHAEHLASFVTGMRPDAISADVRSFVAGRRVDDDASVLMRYGNGARGVLTCSQVCFGEENNLSLRVYGEKGSLRWCQEDPNRLEHRDDTGATRVLTRGGGGLSPAARDACRLPPGHPEAFIEAFANIYRGAIDRIRGVESTLSTLAPTAEDGAHGVRFIERCLASAADNAAWVDA